MANTDNAVSKPDGGPAFPSLEIQTGYDDGSHEYTGNVYSTGQNGMTLRDYFAAKALQGMLADSNTIIDAWSVLAARCYDMADAMLAERDK